MTTQTVTCYRGRNAERTVIGDARVVESVGQLGAAQFKEVDGVPPAHRIRRRQGEHGENQARPRVNSPANSAVRRARAHAGV